LKVDDARKWEEKDDDDDGGGGGGVRGISCACVDLYYEWCGLWLDETSTQFLFSSTLSHQ
jgi:hypothetical protein